MCKDIVCQFKYKRIKYHRYGNGNFWCDVCENNTGKRDYYEPVKEPKPMPLPYIPPPFSTPFPVPYVPSPCPNPYPNQDITRSPFAQIYHLEKDHILDGNQKVKQN